MPDPRYFPLLNARFDVKHIVTDYKQESIPDVAVYELAKKTGRLLVTHNVKDFIELSKQSTVSGIIGISAKLSPERVDTKITALLRRSTPRGLYGKVTEITGETEF